MEHVLRRLSLFNNDTNCPRRLRCVPKVTQSLGLAAGLAVHPAGTVAGRC